jgi:glycolate dehydrogenase FAD-binding subunit
MNTSTTIAGKFESIVGPRHVCAASAKDAVAGEQPEFVVSPGNEKELAAVLGCANEAGVAVIPRGGGTKLDWGNPPRRAEIVLSTARMNRVVEHAWADLTVVVEAGCTMQSVQDALAKHRQRLALDALWPERATIGGVLSTNDSGVLRLRFGALRDLIIGVTLALPDGTLASSGGKVVKNVAGYDLPKLATGAMGTLGVITRAIFRLHPLPRASRTITCAAEQHSHALRMIAQLLDSNLAYSALQTRFLGEQKPGTFVDILFEGTDAGMAAQVASVKLLAATLPVIEAHQVVWQTRQMLHSEARAHTAGAALLKMSARPTDALSAIGDVLAMSSGSVKCDATVQATGLGVVLLKGDPAQMPALLKSLRAKLEAVGGSLVVLGNAPAANHIDCWGAPGDALPLLRAVKQQFDPKATLNPGRFVGGI